MDASRPNAGRDEPTRARGSSLFRKDGEYWTIAFDGQAIRLKDTKGLHCLAHLLRNPGREFHVTDLVNVGEAEVVADRTPASESSVAADLGDAGEALDSRARNEYRRRLEDLRAEVAEAEGFNDTGRAERAREEIEAITRELAAAAGLGGRDRPAASHAERARVMVTQRVKTALARIRESHPSLGRHLSATVKTGYFCSYTPDPDRPVWWHDSPDGGDTGVGAAPVPDVAAGSTPIAAEPEASVRRLSAIFCADVEGYTRLMNEDEAGTIRKLGVHRKHISELVTGHRGRVVDAPGDNLLAEFASAVDAVECALAVQSALAAANATVPRERRMEFRIGINVGDVVADGERIYGDGVNVAARVERLAEAGGICISGSVFDQVKNRLAIACEDLGAKTLKNIPEPVRVYRVRDRATGWKPMPREDTRRAPVAAVVATLLVVLGAYALRTFVGLPSPVAPPIPGLPLPDRPSVAILPFANLTGDPKQDNFARGITEDLITDAGKVSGLFVIAHDSVLPYRGKPVDVKAVGRDLGVGFVLEGSVRYVLEGSVRRAGDEVRINARLWDAASGRQLWAERYDRPSKDTFAVGDEILRHLVADMKVEVDGAELERVRRVPTGNLTAYDSYLRGLDLSGSCSAASVAEARGMFERAIALDPTFAAAYAELGLLAVGEVYGPVAVHKLCASGVYAADRNDWWPLLVPTVSRLDELAGRALALDDSLPLAHVLNGFLEPGTPRAVSEADRALALAPGDARAHVLSAAIYSTSARSKEAITLLEKALRMNPRHPDWYSFHLGRAYALADRYEDAIAALRKVAVANPDFLWAHLELAAIYRKLGREEEAKVEERETLRLSPETATGVVPLPAELVPADREQAAQAPRPSPTAAGPSWFFRLK